MNFKNILVPVDFIPASEATLKLALEMAGGGGAKVHVVNVLPDYGYSMVAQYFAEDAMEKAQEESLQRLHKFVEQHGGGKKIGEVIVRTGTIYEEILRAAEECNADLIVIAGRTGERIGPFLMGSNSEKVVRYAPCSVMVLKEGF